MRDSCCLNCEGKWSKYGSRCCHEQWYSAFGSFWKLLHLQRKTIDSVSFWLSTLPCWYLDYLAIGAWGEAGFWIGNWPDARAVGRPQKDGYRWVYSHGDARNENMLYEILLPHHFSFRLRQVELPWWLPLRGFCHTPIGSLDHKRSFRHFFHG